MLKAIRRWWRYLGAKLGMQLEAAADPKVQLEQAISEAREQHRLLTEQAANIIANQSQLQMRLDRAIEEYEQASGSARQALLLADQATAAGDTERAASLNQAAQGFAARMISLERDMESLKRSLLDATAASDRAKQAVRTSSAALQKKLAEREALLSRLDQAQMQEQMNAAMQQLSAGVGGDVPTLDEVRAKIDRRLAAAHATTEVQGTNVDLQMLEVEEAQRQAETEARLGELRGQLGIRVTPVATPALADPAPVAPVVPVAEPAEEAEVIEVIDAVAGDEPASRGATGPA
jgi:phage shock protein A